MIKLRVFKRIVDTAEIRRVTRKKQARLQPLTDWDIEVLLAFASFGEELERTHEEMLFEDLRDGVKEILNDPYTYHTLKTKKDQIHADMELLEGNKPAYLLHEYSNVSKYLGQCKKPIYVQGYNKVHKSNNIDKQKALSVPITTILGQYNIVNDKSKSIIGCPLPDHNDDTPSFCIYHDTNSYYCFGCGSGGDVIDLYSKMNGVKFIQAVRELNNFT